jgi:5-methyltetrahydrofolate--homocysteine methyltransferase
MQQTDILRAIEDKVINLDLESVKSLVTQAINDGVPAQKIMNDGVTKGIQVVGKKYEEMEYFMTDLILGAEIVKVALAILEPHFKMGDVGAGRGKIVLVGTVSGDLHDLGKNIFVSLLKGAGFKVYDLGTDTPNRIFVEKTGELKPEIVAMSCLVTTSIQSMKEVVQGLNDANLRKDVKVIIGGGAMNQNAVNVSQADTLGKDAVDGVRICVDWVRGS